MNINANLSETALQRYGSSKQLFKAVEEVSEYQVALIHFQDKKCNIKDVAEEMADVLITMKQMQLLVGISDEMLQRNIDYKEARLAGKLK